VQQRQERSSEARASFELAIAAQQTAHERAPEVSEFREALSKHYYNYAQLLRSLDRPADAAQVTLARRKLWPNDAARLVRIAEELAAMCKQLPAGEARQRYLHETSATLQAAINAGLESLPDLDASPFDVLAHDSKLTALRVRPQPASATVKTRMDVQ
jgi:hypothetical protein